MLSDLRACAVRALAARTHDAAVQHSRQAHVLHVDVLAADLVRDVVSRGTRLPTSLYRDGFLPAPCR